MRRLNLLKELFSLPLVVIVLLAALLGNLSAVIAAFPGARNAVAALTTTPWLAPVIAWLARAATPNWVTFVQIILFVALFEQAYWKLRVHYWQKPRIALSAIVEMTEGAGGVIASARLLAQNLEDQPITDCAATLETATNVSGARMAPLIKIRNSRLRWADSEAATVDCQIALPPGATRRISVASALRDFQFTACKPSTSDSAILGLYMVRIRVDGKLVGNDIEPQYFDGYLRVEQGKKGGGLSVLFESGDWKRDKRLAKLKR